MTTAAEEISTMMDGMPAAPLTDAAWCTLQQPEAAQTWTLYHLIGDTLRSPGSAYRNLAVRDRIMAALAEEAAIIARPKPRFFLTNHAHAMQRYALPGVAAVAAVAMVGSMVWSSSKEIRPEYSNLAQVSTPIATQAPTLLVAETQPAAETSAMPGNLADYLAVHQQYSPVVQFYSATPSDSGVIPAAAMSVANDGRHEK